MAAWGFKNSYNLLRQRKQFRIHIFHQAQTFPTPDIRTYPCLPVGMEGGEGALFRYEKN